MRSEKPFSKTFGLADTRLNCAVSAQRIYRDLPYKDVQSGVLRFDAICNHLAQRRNLNEKVLKKLIKLFRPERDGTLLMIDFIRSIDEVYKSLQCLKASIVGSSQIDEALGTLSLICFLFIMFLICLIILGVNLVALLTTMFSFITSISFLFKNASSDWFQVCSYV